MWFSAKHWVHEWLLGAVAAGLVLVALPLGAQPSIAIGTSDAAAGGRMELSGSGFTPGGYPGLVLWDGIAVERIRIPVGGRFAVDTTIPATVADGIHIVSVCAATLGGPCLSEDLEQRAFTKTVIDNPTLPLAIMDLVAAAVEVTQGVRTDIPSQTEFLSTAFVTDDDFDHVANRRTIVRVYPGLMTWPAGREVGRVPEVTARVIGIGRGGILPGSPLAPTEPLLLPDNITTLNARRADASKSWNFVLPESWTTEGTIRLVVEVNPAGALAQPECPGCIDNNIFELPARFVALQLHDVNVKIHATTLHWRNNSGTAQSMAPSFSEIAKSVAWWLKTSPIDPDRVRFDWRFMNMAWDYANDMPVAPPIPFVARATDVQDAITSDNAGAPPNYTFLPIVLNSVTPYGCQGIAPVGSVMSYLLGACGPVFAHETAHTQGRTHACSAAPCAHGEERGGAIDPSYPTPDGAIEANAYGFDIWNMVAVPPERFEHTHDFMSYGGRVRDPFGSRSIWVSMYTWQSLRRAFQTPVEASAATTSARLENEPGGGRPFLEIAGDVTAGGAVRLAPVFYAELPVTAPTPADDPDGDYRILLRGRRGRILAERRFNPVPRAAHGAFEDNGFGSAHFRELFEPIDGVRSLSVMKDGREIFRQRVTRRLPAIAVHEPTGGAKWDNTGNAVVSWKARDRDSDSSLLSYRIEALRRGTEHEILAVGSGEAEARLDLSQLPLGEGEWEIRVQVSDGFNIATETIAPVHVAAKAPRPLIIAPLDGEVVRSGSSVALRAIVADLQDPDFPDASLRWAVDGKPVGNGPKVHLDLLAPGAHTARVDATNSHGLTAWMEIRFFVESADPNPNADSDEDGLVDAAEYAVWGADPLVADSDKDSLNDGLEVELGGDPINPDTDGDGFTDGEEHRLGSNLLAFDEDGDGDRVPDSVDNCANHPNPSQSDADRDAIGDACDPDADGDSVLDDVDACPLTVLGDPTDLTGCSVAQRCPCEELGGNALKRRPRRQHWRYVKCVSRAAGELRQQGKISRRDRFHLIREALRSSCGLGR